MSATHIAQPIYGPHHKGVYEKEGIRYCAQDSLFYAAASAESGLVTAGAQERHLPDYERFWRERLAKGASGARRMPAGALVGAGGFCIGVVATVFDFGSPRATDKALRCFASLVLLLVQL